METPKLYQYAILWHPTKQEREDDRAKSKVVVEPSVVLAANEQAALLTAARTIPKEYDDQLEQVEVALRPF